MVIPLPGLQERSPHLLAPGPRAQATPQAAMAAAGSASAAMLKDWNASYWLKLYPSTIPCSAA